MRDEKIAYKKILCIFVESIEVLFMKIIYASKDMIFPCPLHQILIRIFWFYISGKNGSVFKTIPDSKRKKSPG